jgi:aspartate/glutamate racemase
MTSAPRIALIHALAQSVAPINDAMARDWPEAFRMNLLDDSLSADLARCASGLDDAMHARFAKLGRYAVEAGCDAILFTCSAFGPCIEAVAREHPAIPVLKPNEAMIEDAVALHLPVGLVATFAPTLASMPAEFPAEVELQTQLAAGALQALQAGHIDTHNRLVADAAAELATRGCAAIALAQFSMACAADAVAKQTGLPVLTTVASAVAKLKRRLHAQRRS